MPNCTDYLMTSTDVKSVSRIEYEFCFLPLMWMSVICVAGTCCQHISSVLRSEPRTNAKNRIQLSTHDDVCRWRHGFVIRTLYTVLLFISAFWPCLSFLTMFYIYAFLLATVRVSRHLVVAISAA